MRLVVGNILLLGVLSLAGCLPSQQPPAKADFRATDTPSRVPAIVGASDTDDAAALLELVHALSDKDPAIRLFAIRSLEQRTGQTFGYRYYASSEQRSEATARWTEWLLNNPDIDTAPDSQP